MSFNVVTIISLIIFSLSLYGVFLWGFRNLTDSWNLLFGLGSNVFGGFFSYYYIGFTAFDVVPGGLFYGLSMILGPLFPAIVIGSQLIATFLFAKTANFYAILGVWLIYPLSYVSLYFQYSF